MSGDTIFLGNILLKENTDGSFGVFKADEAEPTPLEIVLKEGQVTDTELSEDSTDIKSRFTTHKDAVEGRLDTIEGDDQTTGSIAKALADAKDYADNEIDAAKLSLGTNFSVADITARDALVDLTVGDIVFVADNGDGKFAQYKVTVASPNEAFLKIMDEDILLNALSAANIKSAYEGNADTNAFTDNEKTNLTNLSNVTKEIATESEAETGESNNKYMTPLRTANAIAFQTNVIDGGEFN